MDLKNLKLNLYTDAELSEIFNAITEIQNQRKEEKKKQLVENFEKAYLALREANISIYFDGCEIWSFNDLEFD